MEQCCELACSILILYVRYGECRISSVIFGGNFTRISKEYKTVGTCEYCESIFRGGTSRPAGQGSIRHHSSPRIPPSALEFACLLFYKSLLGDIPPIHSHCMPG